MEHTQSPTLSTAQIPPRSSPLRGRGEDVLRAWADACDQLWHMKYGTSHEVVPWSVEHWLNYFADERKGVLSNREGCSLLRCLIGPNPRTLERVTCPECVPAIKSLEEGGFRVDFSCAKCKNIRTIPKPLDPRWKSSTAIDLAAAIRTEGTFGRMSILGDALQDSWCDDQEILWHCYSNSVHTSACWVLDSLLKVR